MHPSARRGTGAIASAASTGKRRSHRPLGSSPFAACPHGYVACRCRQSASPMRSEHGGEKCARLPPSRIADENIRQRHGHEHKAKNRQETFPPRAELGMPKAIRRKKRRPTLSSVEVRADAVFFLIGFSHAFNMT